MKKHRMAIFNTSTTAPLTFGVAYFVPVGAPLLTPVSAPCP